MTDGWQIRGAVAVYRYLTGRTVGEPRETPVRIACVPPDNRNGRLPYTNNERRYDNPSDSPFPDFNHNSNVLTNFHGDRFCNTLPVSLAGKG
jgi:hypothetical protein